MKNKNEFEIISFDMDGTLIPGEFVDDFWLKKMPELYAESKGILKEEASSELLEEYDKIGEKDIRWYEPRYWFRELDIERKPEDVIEEMRVHYHLFDDAVEAIKRLHHTYELVVISNGHQMFIESSLEGYKEYFLKTYSSVSDFGLHSKTSVLYEEVCADLNVEPSKVIHVGDSLENDYEPSKEAGLKAYLLDREKKFETDADVLTDLRDLVVLLKA